MAVEVPHFGVFTNNDANILCEGEKSSPPARSQEQARGFGCATHFLPLTTVDHDFHGATAIQQMARFQTLREAQNERCRHCLTSDIFWFIPSLLIRSKCFANGDCYLTFFSITYFHSSHRLLQVF